MNEFTGFAMILPKSYNFKDYENQLMENIQESPFLTTWHTAMIISGVIMFVVALLIYLAHAFKVASIKDYKQKYDYLSLYEIRNYKRIFLCLGISACLFVNIYGIGKVNELGLWFFVRLFISIAGGTLVAYVAVLVLDYYYPTILDKKLRKWRYMPRINVKTGREMRLLGEEEEDVHLQEGMQAEENVFSIDYDVWVDDQTGDVKIDKYPGHLQASKCNTCGFFTMKVVKEEITKQPSVDDPGELIKHYQCNYCKSVRATAFKISTKEDSDYKTAAAKGFKKSSNIEMIRVEIYSSASDKKFFEFQSIDEAKKFLNEYNDSTKAG